MIPVISAKGLSKKYGDVQAVNNVTFEVNPGRIIGLIGPNGSGKTTTLKAILGLIRFEGGLTVLEHDPRTQRSELMRDVCFIADAAILPRWLSVNDAISFVEAVHPKFNRAKAESYISKTKLSLKMKVKDMSKGMVAQLHLALVMAINAKLLVLDEPTLGLDVFYRTQFYQSLIEDYCDSHNTIVISSHQIDELETILTDVIFMRDGEILLSASMDEVETRFFELTVDMNKINEANSLNPLNSATVFGKTVMLFDNVPRSQLEQLGRVTNPSLADLFAAKAKGDNV